MASHAYRCDDQNNRWLNSLPDARLMVKHGTRWIVVLVACGFVVGCAAPPAADFPISLPEPADFPHARYEAARLRGEPVYEIDAKQSMIQVYAYRAGSLSRMGHDHVIASRGVGGFVLVARNAGGREAVVQADLFMSLYSMTVDDEDLRAEAGFGTKISERARVGTRSNMLASLDAAEFPLVTLHIEGVLENRESIAAKIPLRATIALHGVSMTIEVIADVSMDADSIQAEGHFTLRQSDFGIKPHSALGGALSVRDELDITFRIGAVIL